MAHQTSTHDPNQPEDNASAADVLPQEGRFNQRGSFEGAYGEGSAEAWQDEQTAQRTSRPNPERPSAMGGASTAYDPDNGFAHVDPQQDDPEP